MNNKYVFKADKYDLQARGKKTLAGASTRNKCRNTPGKRRGLKVYDGQRVPSGCLLVKQLRLQILPGDP